MRFLLALAFLLSACGGGGGGGSVEPPVYQTKMMVNGTAPGFNSSISFPSDTDLETSVAKQVALPGNIALTNVDIAHLDQGIALAKANPQVKWLYLYDELFWREGRVQIGLDDVAISAAARKVQQAGLKSAISIIPDIVMRPDFVLSDPNAFRVIALDLYPSISMGGDTHGCFLNNNKYTNMLACSIQKLRAMGYTGEVWYVYQAFVHSGDANLLAEMQEQAQTIKDAPSLGYTGLVSFGYFPDGLASPLLPGKDSAIDQLVK